MEFNIYKPHSLYLKDSIEYFLFIKSTTGKQADAYTTLPNTNLCLSLYKNNEIHWDRESNHCQIRESDQFAVSKVYGWHRQPFQVKLSGTLDQICVVFKPAGLSHFTSLPLNQLSIEENPFAQLFEKDAASMSHRLFEHANERIRLKVLESFFTSQLKQRTISLVELFIDQMIHSPEHLGIHAFCKANKVNESTLYRHFLAKVGESAKKFERKHRFRNFLKKLNTQESFTSLSYALNYADQSHFIKESKKFTGKSPRQLAKSIQRIENELLLVV